MAKVKTSDIRTRLTALNESYTKQSNVNVHTVYERVMKGYNYNNAKLVIENWASLDKNSNFAFEKAMIVFDIVCENGTESEINALTNYIIENVVPKVRDGAQTAELIKRKIGRFKTKVSTKINNRVEDMKNAVQAHTPKATVPAAVATTAPVVANPASAGGSSTTVQPGDSNADNSQPEQKEETPQQEAYNRILETVNTYRQCDRVLSNHTKISKRFNIDKYIVEKVNCEDDIEDCIHGICEFIETFNIPFGVKYNVALENINYALDKNGIKFDKKVLINTCTDYFLINQPMTVREGACISDMRYVLENNKFFDECDLDDVDYLLYPEEDEEECEDEFMDNEYGIYSYSESNKLIEKAKDETKKIVKKTKDGTKKIVKKTKNAVKDLINQFKMEQNKQPKDMRGLISKIYTKSAEDIIDETPNIFGLIRVYFIMGATALNPILGLITFMVDAFIKMDLSRKETKKMIDQYNKELKKTEGQIAKTKDPEKKKRLEDYKKTLEAGIKKLDAYYEDLLSEEEADAKREEDYNKKHKNSKASKDEFGLDIDDDDWGDLDSWDESSIELIKSILILSEAVETLNEYNFDTVLDNLENKISKLDIDSLDSLTSLCFTVDGDCARLADILDREYKECKDRGSRDYMRYDCLSSNIYKLKHTVLEPKNEANIVEDTYILSEAMEYLNRDIVVEASIANSLKLASEKLKKTMVKLSDKEKTISKNIDASMATISNSIEAALTNDSRENVIKGRILPSASKTLKIALAAGTAWALKPAVAVIGMLGALAMSKKLEAKQRQLILDEIEIELQMVKKYIRLAEDKNDMKALRELLHTQKTLERQRARIKYKMKLVYNQKVSTDTKTRDSSDYDYD